MTEDLERGGSGPNVGTKGGETAKAKNQETCQRTQRSALKLEGGCEPGNSGPSRSWEGEETDVPRDTSRRTVLQTPGCQTSDPGTEKE